MMKTRRRIVDSVLSIVLSLIILVGMMPISIFAVEKVSGELSTDIGDKVFMLNEATEFTFTTKANDDANTMVKGSFVFSDPDAIEKLEYLESKNGKWYEFDGDFGPATGFPMIDGTSTFRVTFNKVGNYKVTALMKTVADNTTVCSVEANVTVKRKSAELATNISEGVFSAGVAKEFTYTTTANDDLNTMVKGTFEFSAPEAIEKLEYLESKNGQWYEFYGDFGPATGFPMIDGTSTFRVTFNRAGNFTVTAAMKAVADSAVLCTLTSNVSVEHKVTATVSKNEGGTVLVDDKEVSSKTVDAGSTMKITAKADDGYQIASLSIGGAEIDNVYGKTEFTVNPVIGSDVEVVANFVKVYTVTVIHSENGSTEIVGSEIIAGKVTVEEGSNVKIKATPDANFRVSEVKINDKKDNTITGTNNAGYEKTLVADKDYVVVITFAPNTFNITKGNTENGSIALSAETVDYEGSCVVTVTPDAGYSVTSVKVNGADINTYESDKGSVKFTILGITESKKVEATFAPTKKCNIDIKMLFNDEDAVRFDGMTYIFKNDDFAKFSTAEEKITLYAKNGQIIGQANSGEIITVGSAEIGKIELVYQAEGEMAPMVHESVGVSSDKPLKIVIDKSATESTLTPNAANQNGYYNSDVTFEVKSEDKGDYSGIATVQYWITLNGVEGRINTLYNYNIAKGDVLNVFEGSFTVDASIYNSDDIKVSLKVVDRAGNEEVVEKTIKINSTKPTVSLAIDGNQNNNAQEKYYNDKRTLTLTVVDREDTFSQSNAAEGLEIYKNDALIEVAATDITWKRKDGSNLYEGTYVFEDDAHYTWSFVYTNLAGLSNDGVTVDANSKDIYEFYVDKAEPYGLAISYNPDFVGVFLDATTFGFYGQDSINVTVEATDDTAGIAKFECTYGDKKIEISGDAITRNGTKASASFDIPAQFRGSVSIKAIDRAGRATELTDEKVVVIDTIAPGVTVTWSPAQGSNGKYFNANRVATIEIEEANFFAQDVEDGLLKITSHIVYNDGTSKDETYKPKFTFENGKYVATITFSEEADYTFDVTYTDRAGNVYDGYPAEEFTIDKTNPIISVKYDNNNAVNENQFKKERTATITVIEHNFNKDAMNVLVNSVPVQVEWKNGSDADTYIAEVPFTGDAHYTFDVSGKDFADNSNDEVIVIDGTVAPWSFTVDKSGPVDLKISYESTFVGTLLEGITYGFYKAPVTVKIEATDDVSGIDYFTYSYIVQDNASAINVGAKDVKVDANGGTFVTFDIPAQFRGFVSFTATNRAGISASAAEDKAVVVDDIAPGIQVVYENNDAKNDKYYDADRKATITIEEANFFAKDIEDGLLVITRKAVANDGTVKEEILKPQFTKIANSDKYAATIDFNQDADYTFDIKYTDRAGNVYDDYEADEFTIDKIAPKISIEKANGAYFNTNRTAKITVVEHNFRASDFDFTANAYNVRGRTSENEIEISSKAYRAYLQNQDNWTKVAADTWEAEITFDIEGNYVIGATYSDPAGNAQEEAISDTFCVDKSSPDNMKISYESTFIGVLLETITYGFYKAPVKVTIEAIDDIAGVDHFVYSYTVQEGASDTNAGKVNQNAPATRDGATNRWYTSFEIPAQFRGFVSFMAYDKASNGAYLADKNVVVVDNIAPGVNVVYNNMNQYDELHYKAARTATITINEANFFAQDIEDDLLVITVEKTLNDGKFTSNKMTPVFAKDGDVYTATVLFDEDADYTFDVKYTDRSGNVYDSYKKDAFTVDKIAPVIEVTYDNNDAKNDDQFKANRTATIKVTEHNFRADYVVAKVMASGTEVTSYAEYLKNDANWTHDGDVHTAVIEYSEEAHYTFEIACTDKAGNISAGVNYGQSVAPTEFTIDKSAPTEMDIKIDDKSVKGSMSTHTFNTFYGATVTVKLSANCDISGLDSFKYQKVSDIRDYNADGTWTDYNDETGIVVAPSEKFVIYFRAEDRAGNVNIIRSTGIVVDNKKPVGETNAPEIDIFPEDHNKNGLHKDDVNVDLRVIDPKYSGANAAANGYYSGLNKITYRIYTTDTDAVEEGTLLDLAYKTDGAVFDADNLISSWSGSITVDSEKFNSNNVIVEVVAVDNAGNERRTTTLEGDIKIDITAPKIVVSYDNNSADSGSFFKNDRTATIEITERNFNANDVVVTITNTDGEVPSISAFTKKVGTGNGDDTIWTATIKYTIDGDYEFDIAYTDLAENVCAGETFARGTVAANAFTIDHTIPVVKVTYDNNNALNGNYYKASRTATIVVTEHNFNADRVAITITATDDGVGITKPAISGWTSDGDTHTTTIHYGKDARYTFDIVAIDKAGNASADYAEDIFFIDTTMPTLEITGVEDKSANNGDVIPVVSYSDTNYDSENVTITLTGANRKEVKLSGSYSNIHNGRTFTFNNFEKEPDIDDIYTLSASLTDKAGNTTEKTISFSVNRFGSTYALSKEAEKLNGTYVKAPIDIVITETNTDELSNIKITLFKDGKAKVLKGGSDYKIETDGGNGNWYHYTYTILAKNFAADGVYSLTVESNDKAGNTSKNDLDTKDKAISFGIDSTLPIINIENLESKNTYAVDNMTVSMSIMDNLMLVKVIVELDGKEYKVWSSEEVAEIVKNGGSFSFDISGDSVDAHKLVVYAIDAAGNGEKISNTERPANAEEVEEFYVTTNLWVRFYTNKPLFYGSIAGVIILAGLIVFLVVYKKKKNEGK